MEAGKNIRGADASNSGGVLLGCMTKAGSLVQDSCSVWDDRQELNDSRIHRELEQESKV
jgi:hypothetical protein